MQEWNQWEFRRTSLPEQILPEQRTNAQYVARNDAEGYHYECNEYGQSGVDGKVMLVQFEESSHGRQIGKEQEVKQVDVQCASAYVLQTATDECHFCEVGSIVAEIHK